VPEFSVNATRFDPYKQFKFRVKWDGRYVAGVHHDIPRALAAWGVIASAWCAACTFVFIISPDFAKVVNLWWFDSPMGIFEIVTSFWLLFKGLKPYGTADAQLRVSNQRSTSL